MFVQKVKVTYVDGTVSEVTLDQWSIGQWAQYATRQGLKMDIEKPGILAVLMLRFQAWAQQYREASTKPGFDVWDKTVVEVTPEEEPEEADPTQTAT